MENMLLEILDKLESIEARLSGIEDGIELCYDLCTETVDQIATIDNDIAILCTTI